MNHLSIKITAFLLILCCLSNESKAQLDSSDFSFQVIFAPDLVHHSGLDTAYFHKIEMNLLDTVNVSKIAVKTGTSLGAGDVEEYDFIFDTDTFLPKGYAYYRKGNEVHLTLGKHLNRVYYFEIKLIDTNGMTTVPKKWNTWNQ